MKKILLLAAISSIFIACAKPVEEESIASVNATQVKRGTTTLQIEFPGQIAGSIDIAIRAQVGGILKERLYKEGSHVTKDTPLFIIDQQPYQVALKKAEGSLAQAESEVRRTKREYNRMHRLFKQSAVSAKEHDEALSAYEAAEANLQVAKAGVDDAKINLDYTTVKAPIDGIVGREIQSIGSLINPANPDSSLLTSMVKINPLYVNFSIPSTTWAIASKVMDNNEHFDIKDDGVNVRIVSEQGDVYPHIGKIFFADSAEDTKTASIALKAEIPNPELSRKLIPGQFVKVQFLGYTVKDVIVVPVSSIIQEDYGNFVYTIKGGVIDKQKVTIAVVGSVAFVLDGLKEGDIVVLEGIVKVKPGQKAKAILQLNPAEESESQIEQDKQDISKDEQNVCKDGSENCKIDNELEQSI